MRTHKEIRWRLIRSAASIGSYSEWRAACDEARDAGWTYKEVKSILLWFSPLSLLIEGICIILLISALASWVTR